MQIAKKQARTTSKYAIAKYTQVFSTSNLLNITGPQRTKTIFFFLLYLYLLILRYITGHCCTSVAFFIL